MRAPLLCLLALTTLAPFASAEPLVMRHTDTVVQSQDGLLVFTQVDFLVVDPATFDGKATLDVPASAAELAVNFVRDGVRQDFNTTAIARAAAGDGFDRVTANLSQFLTSAPNGTRYTVVASYRATGTEARFRVTHDATIYVMYVAPVAGQRPRSATLGEFQPSGLNEFHAAKARAAAGSVFDLTFANAPAGATTQDQNPWAWAGGGLLVGLIVMFVAVRQGWLAAPGKAKKFVKGGEMESRSMLEARRRTLLAALKELEQAHETKEVADADYAPLKEEYKAQAVRVMRSLEGKKE